MVTLLQLCKAIELLNPVDGEKEIAVLHINNAIDELKQTLESLNSLTVKGRDSVDTLLGCMMATETIIGEDSNGK